MENIDIEQIESYLQGKMTSEERAQFESFLAADPELRRRTDELRQFANDLRQVARADLRKRVEAVRDQIKQEEANLKVQPKTRLNHTAMLAIGILIGTLLGLVLGWLFFHKEQPIPLVPIAASDEEIPIAIGQFDSLHHAQIPDLQSGKTISFTVLHNPDLDSTTPPVRAYKFYGLDGGLCIYAGRHDIFWENKAIEITQSGPQFFLKIGDERFPVIGDGAERPLQTEQPSGN